MTSYQPPPFFRNPHLQTLFPTLFRRVPGISYTRERISTPDDDFLDLDWVRRGSNRLVVVSHGLEGDSQRAYVKGMVRAALKQGFDALAWNFRGCSGVPNRQPRLYHSGSDNDLETVLRHVLEHCDYRAIALVGFSMGGNVSLVYLGRRQHSIDPRIKCCVAFSVPGDLADCSRALARPENRIYMKRFLKMLHAKVRMGQESFPELINDRDYHLLRDFYDFDNRYTAPLHGFKDAEDYWRQCSAARFIPGIRIPTLLVSALDDPFLGPGCYPRKEAAANPVFTFETPAHGGHVGFVSFNREKIYWSERRALAFINGNLS
jgi:predicted alpha/beta-fold hydrolase